MSCSIPLRTKVGILTVALVVGAGLLNTRAATIPELWPATLTPLAGDALTARCNALDSANLPTNLRCAAQLQKIIFQIVSKAPAATWRSTLETLAQSAENESVRDVARVWLARAQIKDIDAVLKRYYAKKVSFPGTLPELGAALPEQLRNDPWGEPWAYSLHAPRGMSKLTNQRYQLGPKRYPDLMTQKHPPVPVFTKITLGQIGSDKILTLESANGRAAIQPGGVAAGATLLHIGDKWALLATQDQLFAVTF
jgi:hypothetical protein